MFLREWMCSLVLLSAFGVCVAAAPPGPQRDRYGDPLPEGAIARLGSLHLRNEEAILTAAYTADGKTLAAVGVRSISFWDLVMGKLVRRVDLENAAVPVQIQRLSADGKTLIQAPSGAPNVLYVRDAPSGLEERRLTRARCGPLHRLDVSRDGKIVVAVHQDSIALWDVPNGKLLYKFWGPPVIPLSPDCAVALAPDGKQLALQHTDGSLHLVDVATGKELRAVEMPPGQGRRPPPHLQRIVFSPDSRFLVLGGPATPLTVCEVATGKRLHELRPPQGNYYTGTAFTPDGRLLAVDEHTGIRLFDVRSGKEVRKLPLTAPARSILVFSPDGRVLAAVGGYTIKLWDMAAQRWLHPLKGHEHGIQSLVFFPDGKRLVSADYTCGMRVWDIASAQTLAQQTNNTACVSVAVDKRDERVRFAGCDISVHCWDPRTGRDEVRPPAVAGVSTDQLALSSDGRSLAVLASKAGGEAGKVRQAAYELRLYDLASNQSIKLPGLPERSGTLEMQFAPDSRRLAACCHDRALRLWERDTGKLVREFKSEAWSHPMYPIFAADGRSLLVWMDGMVRIREVAGGGDRLRIPPMPSSLFSLAYSPDARLVARGLGDGQIFVYSAVSGKQLAQWQGKQGEIGSLAFSRDGLLLASGGANGTILIWKVPQEERLPVVLKAEEVDSLWQALGDSDAANANRALASLVAAPAQALPLFRERLRPIGKPADCVQVARLIAELDDDSFKVREQATREIAWAGEIAAEALRQALKNNPSIEAKRRIEDLLARLKTGGDSQRLRFVRALEALERIGSPQAKELLHSLAGEPLPADLCEEVQASLRRLGELGP